ncbi:MAG: ROK family protein [Ruminococcaceae bacterium]|nr:ROK family protein [Oscillospiraceae bacterium]
MYYLGIDLGGTNIAAGIVNDKYEIVKKKSTPTLANRDGKLIIKDMAELCRGLIADCGLTVDDIEYAGIATPGTANSETGVVEYANNLPFKKFPLADLLKEYLGVKKVYIENDANAAAKAEAIAGAARGAKFSVMITLGTGLGGGIVLDGKVYSGFNFAGAELGHIVIEKDGKQCTCGRRGCWEAYSSATGLTNMTKEHVLKARQEGRKTIIEDMINGNIDNCNARVSFAAMKQGDEVGKEIVDEYISYLANGIASIINIFQPNVLSIGGGVCNEKEYLTKPLIEEVFKQTYTKTGVTPQTEIKIAELGNDAGIVGAAVLGL